MKTTVSKFIEENRVIAIGGEVIVDNLENAIKNWNSIVDDLDSVFGPISENDIIELFRYSIRLKFARKIFNSAIALPEMKTSEKIVPKRRLKVSYCPMCGRRL